MEKHDHDCPRKKQGCANKVIVTPFGVSHTCMKPLIYKDLREESKEK